MFSGWGRIPTYSCIQGKFASTMFENKFAVAEGRGVPRMLDVADMVRLERLDKYSVVSMNPRHTLLYGSHDRLRRVGSASSRRH